MDNIRNKFYIFLVKWVLSMVDAKNYETASTVMPRKLLASFFPDTVYKPVIRTKYRRNGRNKRTNMGSVQCLPLYNFISQVSHGFYVTSPTQVLHHQSRTGLAPLVWRRSYVSCLVIVVNMLTAGHRTRQVIFSRKNTYYSALYAVPHPSVRLSVTRVDQSKTVEVRIMQLSPHSSPHDSSFLVLHFTAKFQRERRERWRRISQGYEKYAIFSQ